MAKVLTVKSVEQAKAGETRREVPDGLLAGLYLVIQPSGAKSWAVRYRASSKPRKLTLGPYPLLSLAAAREAARVALMAAAKGVDPAAEKVAARRQAQAEAADRRDLVSTVVADHIARYAKPKNRSWRETERLFAREVLPHWGERRIQDITRRDVIELLDGIVDRGAGTTANRTLAAVRRFFNWSKERGVITDSPAAGVKAPTPTRSRDRVLTDEEVRLFWRATETLSYPFGPLVRVLLLTAQRREEVAGMTAAEVDLANRIWMLPRSRAKNDREHTVPLSGPVVELLRSLPRFAGGAGYLFSGTGGRAPASGFSRAKTAIDKRMLELARQDAVEAGRDPDDVAIDPWVVHDLRRTAASGCARLGVAVHVVEAVLNHKSGAIRGVTAVYNRHAYFEEKRAALEVWSRHVEGLVTERPGNVVALRAVS